MSADLTALARELNRAGWTHRAAHEPGDYDRCDECREACDELAAFIAPLIAREKAEAERDVRARQVEVVRDIHTTFYEALSGQIICAECDQPMPCRTVRALDGEDGA